MSAALDPAVADLLAAIREALEGMADWRAAAVTVAVDRALVRAPDDPGAAADWLRGFLMAEVAEADQLEDELAEQFAARPRPDAGQLVDRLVDALRQHHPPHHDVEGCPTCGLIARAARERAADATQVRGADLRDLYREPAP